MTKEIFYKFLQFVFFQTFTSLDYEKHTNGT